jgi:hypothetical protein
MIKLGLGFGEEPRCCVGFQIRRVAGAKASGGGAGFQHIAIFRDLRANTNGRA